MRQTLSNPLLWFFVQVLALLVLYNQEARFDLKFEGDSESYLMASKRNSLGDMLASTRTIGYPMFLKALSLVTPDYSLLPVVQFLVHIMVVMAFWRALSMYGFSKWLGLFAVSPLLYAENVRTHVSFLLSDSLATSFSILTIGMLLMAVSRPKWTYLLLLSLSLFITLQIRMAYLFLLPLIPLLGFSLILFRERPRKIKWKKPLANLIVASIFSLVAVSFLNFAMIRQWGWGGTGGQQLFAIASAFLTDDLTQKLPDDLRPLAQEFVKLRQENKEIGMKLETHEISKAEVGAYSRPLYGSVNIPDSASDFVLCSQEVSHPQEVIASTMSHCYGYRLFLGVYTASKLRGAPFAAPQQESRHDWMAVDDMLKDLAFSIIKEEPFLYLVWVIKGLKYGILRVGLPSDGIFVKLAILWIACGICLEIKRYLLTLLKNGGDLYGNDYSVDLYVKNAFVLMVIIGLSFAFLGYLLAILVEGANVNRYFWAVSPFLSCILSVSLYANLAKIFGVPFGSSKVCLQSQ